MSIEVANLKRIEWNEETDCFGARPSHLGNPFKIGRDGNRLEVIQKYRRWLWRQKSSGSPAWHYVERIAERHKRGEHVRLLCHCYPQPCHLDVVRSAAEWLASQGDES